MSRHATRYNHRDGNEPAIRKTCEDMGVEWYEAGPLDAWIWLGKWIPIEVKTDTGVLTPGQKRFMEQCEMDGRPYRVWRTAKEAEQAINLHRAIRK